MAAASDSFVVQWSPAYSWVWIALAFLPILSAPIAYAFGLPVHDWKPYGWVVAGFTFTCLIVSIARGLPRNGTLRLDPGRLVLVSGRRQVSVEVGPGSATLGKWTRQFAGAVGSVIHIGDLHIGLNGLLLEAAEYERDPCEKVDAWLEATPGRALLAGLRAAGGIQPASPTLGYRSARSRPSWSIELVPASQGTWRVMAIWCSAMALAGVAGFAGSWVDQRLGLVFTVVVLGVGMLLSIRAGVKRSPGRRLVFEDDRVVLVEATPRTPLGGCPREELALKPGHAVVEGRGRWEYMTLEVTAGAAKPVLIGPSDPGFHWTSDTPRTKTARFFVGPEEWRKLLEELELIDRAQLKSRSARRAIRPARQ